MQMKNRTVYDWENLNQKKDIEQLPTTFWLHPTRSEQNGLYFVKENKAVHTALC